MDFMQNNSSIQLRRKTKKISLQVENNDDNALPTNTRNSNFSLTKSQKLEFGHVTQLQWSQFFRFKSQDLDDIDTRVFDNYHYFSSDQVYDVAMKICQRKSQEDRFVAKQKLKSQKEYHNFYGVFDGHRNSIVSSILSQILYKYILNQINFESNIEQAIKQGFSDMDEELLSFLNQNQIQGGSTACCALIQNSLIYIINLGDSRAVFVKKKDCQIERITRDHKACDPLERQLVEDKGAFIFQKNDRKAARVQGELEITRSFGDINYKQYITCEPDIFKVDQNNQQYEYLILATDGFWNVMTEKDVQQKIKQWKLNKQDNIEQLSWELMEESVGKNELKKDNITILIIDLQKLQSQQQKYDQETKNNQQIFFQLDQLKIMNQKMSIDLDY